MTYTGDSGTSGNENEIIYNKNGVASSDPGLVWEPTNNSLLVTGKIEQKVSNLNVVNKYNLGTVSGLYFQGGNIFVSSGNDVIKLDDKGNELLRGVVSNAPNEIINDGVSIYTISTSTNTFSILDQNLNTTNIITDPINLNGPTRFVIYGKYIFITCGTKLSRFNTASKSIDNTVDIENDAFLDVTIKGDTVICLRQTSITEINPDTLQIVKNIPSSNIINPRRITATRDNVFALMDDAILTFDNTLKYKGKSTGTLTNARVISLYGSFIIVGNNAGNISIFDSANIPATLIKDTTVQVSPNSFTNSIIVGSNYYLADKLSENLLHYTLDGIVAGGIKAGTAQISNIETSVLSSETITTKNFSTQNFYTSGSVDGTSGTFGDILIADGAITGSVIRINSGTQSIVLDAEGFKYLNNSEEVIKFKNNGTFESDSIETNIFKISNGTNKFQISASNLLTEDQLLVFPGDNGSFGDVLSTDGNGNLLWRPLSIGNEENGEPVIIIPGGFNGHVQFNEGGVFTASSKFKWDGEHLHIGDGEEISLGHDTETDIIDLSVGVSDEIQLSVDPINGSQLKFSNDKIIMEYNNDVAHITIGNVIISETTITGVANPIANNDVVNKFYADTLSNSSSNNSYWKNPVRCASTINISIPTDGISTLTSLDTVVLNINDRVLLKDQTDQTQNGIYNVTADTWTRTDDVNIGANTLGITFRVLEGYKNSKSTWNCITGAIAGTDNLIFEKTNLGSGISWRESVKCATTINITPFPPIDGIITITTLDGISLVINDRVLIKDQTDSIQNGIYIVTADVWERVLDMDIGTSAVGNALWINQGNTYGDQGWVCVSDIGIVGTDGLSFDIMSAETSPGGLDTYIQFNDNGIFTGSADLTWDGAILDVVGNVSSNITQLKDSGFAVSLQAPTLASDYTLSLPTTVGTANQVLSTGSSPGTLEWVLNPKPYGSLNSIQISDGAGNFSSNTSFKIDNNILKIGTDQLHISYSGAGTTGALINNSNDKDFTFRTDQNTNYIFQDYTATEIAKISDTGFMTVSGLTLTDDDNSNKITIQAPSVVASDFTLTFPINTGTVNQVLKTDGSGALGWITVLTQPPGNDTEIQFNNAGTFGSSSKFTWDGTTLGVDGTLTIHDTGVGAFAVTIQSPTLAADYTLTLPSNTGTVDQVLKTDGSGILSWTNPVVGNDTEIQFNSSGLLGSSTNLTFSGTTLTVPTIKTNTSIIIKDPGSVFTTTLQAPTLVANYILTLPQNDGTANYILKTDGFGVTSWVAPVVGNDTEIQFNSNGAPGSSTNLTFSGTTLTVPTIKTNTSIIIKDPGSVYATTLQASTLSADYTLTLPPNTGTVNQILKTDGAGVLTWIDQDGGVVGNDTEVQFKSGGVMSSSSDLTFDGSVLNTLNISSDTLVLKDDDASNTITLQTPAVVATNYTLTLPPNTGTSDQILKTDGTGILTWITQNPVVIPVGGLNAIQINNPDGTFNGSSDLTFDPDNSSFKQLSTQAPNVILNEILSSGTKSNAVYVIDDIAYVLNKENFRIYDISDKTVITQLSIVSDSSSNLKDIKVRNNLAYIVSNTGNHLKIYDVSDPTSTPVLKSTLTGFTAAFSIELSYNYAYITYGNYVAAIDITEPTNPIKKGVYNVGGTTRFLKVRGNYLLIGVYTGANGFVIVDATDSDNLLLHQTLPTGSGWGVAISSDLKYAFVSRISGNIRVYDLHDIENANVTEILSFVNVDNQITDSRQIFLSGKFLYVLGESSDRFTRIDISNPYDLQYSGSYTDAIIINQPIGIYVSGNYAYVASSLSNSLCILNTGGGSFDSLDTPRINTRQIQTNTVEATQNINIGNELTVFGKSNFADTTHNTIVTANNISSASNICGNLSYSLSVFNKLSEVTGLSNNTTGIAFENNIAYLTGNHNVTLTAVNIADPSNMYKYSSPVTLIRESGVLRPGCQVKDGYVYIAGSGGDEVRVYDATDPANINGTPVFTLGPDSTKYTQIRTMVKTPDNNTMVLFSASSTGGTKTITTIDITDPANPAHLDSIEITASGTGYGSAIGNGYAFSVQSTISAVDISDPANLGVEIAPSPGITTTSTRFSFVDDNKLYILRDGQGLMIVDITTPAVNTSMVLLGSYLDGSVFTEPFEMVKLGNLVYILNQRQGGGGANVILVDVTDPTTPVLEKIIEDSNINWTQGGGDAFPFVRPTFTYQNDAFIYFNEGSDSLMALDTGKISFPKAKIDCIETEKLQISKQEVVQLTSITTPVTINTSAGKITTVSLAIASHESEIFTVNNTLCKSSSIVMCNIISYTGTYNLHCGVNNIQNGSFDIVITNSTGGTLDAVGVVAFFIL